MKAKSCIEWTKLLMGKCWSWSFSRIIAVFNLQFDLPDNLSTNTKLFVGDTSLFSVVHDITISSWDLNYDLRRVKELVFQWKMSFNPKPSKLIQQVIFTSKLQKINYPHYILMTVPWKKLGTASWNAFGF